jgi:hypothetical protein
MRQRKCGYHSLLILLQEGQLEGMKNEAHVWVADLFAQVIGDVVVNIVPDVRHQVHD